MPIEYYTEIKRNLSQAEAEKEMADAKKKSNFEQANLFPEDDGQFTLLLIFRKAD